MPAIADLDSVSKNSKEKWREEKLAILHVDASTAPVSTLGACQWIQSAMRP